MLNRSGITKTTYTAPRQILANVELQSSVGCVVPTTLGVAVGSKKIAKAGTPVVVDLMNLTAPATAATTTNITGVLLHDVDVTEAAANGTVLIFGFVNVNRVETDVAAKIAAITENNSKVTFLKA